MPDTTQTTLEKVLDFMGEHPILTIIIICAVLGGIADIINAVIH